MPFNNPLRGLNANLMRGIYLTIAATFISLSLSIPAQAQEKPEIKYAPVNGVKLAYYLKGKGDPMILIMGYAGTLSAWDPALLDELAKNNQLIIFDNRGAGLSTDTKENNTTIPQMADDAAGLVKALGFKKVNVFSWSMGARIGQQLVIRHPELINKAILLAPNPGGKYQIAINKKVGEELNNPSLSPMENFELLFPMTPEGKAAAKAVYERWAAAKAAGTIPDDFVVSKETKARQVRARITLWNTDNQNFKDLKNIKVPVLVADGREDIIDSPQNSVVIANQIPFAWLAFYEGGHAFLFQSYKKLSETVNVFLQKD
ncbi:alpha/beta hydrolase [Polynucleobacter asymbioticus]|uniref:alpha/beta fold hydrolase n=1 Tax=Polynucleobacter asymbioticus TaxID=576611 RepID=UPI001BFD1CBD|nr:alpha/beta hydrolase [Polynucleobacter asymbioticus]QWD84993.1 alpha/beta hydrolase [Polynucleobacter asymbioticus]